MADWRQEVGEDLNVAVPIRAYARYLNVSDTAVRKAIQRGDIHGSAIDNSDPKRPKIIPALANAQWKQNHNPSYEHNAPQLAAKFQGVKPPAGDAGESAEMGGNATLAAAKRAKAVYDAKLAELEYKQKIGELVKKDDVYRALFAFGQEIRARIQAVPDRTIDDILASAHNRNAAHLVLFNALADVLEQLSGVEDIKISRDAV